MEKRSFLCIQQKINLKSLNLYFEFKKQNMINSQKRAQEKVCNCKNSKCMKLYCQCFAAHRNCGKNCRCFDCHNNTIKSFKDPKFTDKRFSREEYSKAVKGCACRKSNCTKKYCECFQGGFSCKELCKCVDWQAYCNSSQNIESMVNKNTIIQLKRKRSEVSNPSVELYPLYLSQNSDHLNNIINEQNPLLLKDNWLETSAKNLYQSARNGSSTEVMDSFLQILKDIEENLMKKNEQKKQGTESEIKKEQILEVSQKIESMQEKEREEIEMERDSENMQ